MKKLFKKSKDQLGTSVKVLRVTVLLSLGLESVTREYKVKLRQDEEFDETEIGMAIVKYARTKYTAIMHNGGTASLLATCLIN